MELKAYEPGIDDERLLRLRSNVWGADHPHSNINFLRWLFADNPQGRGTGSMVMRNGEVMGFAGIVPYRALLGGKVRSAVLGCDFMVHTEARSGACAFRALAHMIKLCKQREEEFAICFPNVHSHQIVKAERIGWKDVFRPILLLRPLPGAALPKSLAPRIPEWLSRLAMAPLVGRSSARAALVRKNSAEGQPIDVDRFDERFDSMAEHAIEAGVGGVVRNAAYLNWRFVDHPVYAYKRMAWENGGRVAGYIVTSARETFGVPSTLVADVFTAPGAPRRVAESMLEEAGSVAARKGSQMLVALAAQDSPVDTALRAAGFVAVPLRLNPKPFVMAMHPLGNGISPDDLRRHWRFAWSDMDVV